MCSIAVVWFRVVSSTRHMNAFGVISVLLCVPLVLGLEELTKGVKFVWQIGRFLTAD